MESADRDVIVAIATLADTSASLDALVIVLLASIDRHRGDPRPVVRAAAYAVDPIVAMAPRQAFFVTRETVTLEHAVGRISAELIAPYPPGIPVLAPGEEITVDTVAALDQAKAAGVRIAYAADPTLATVVVAAA